MTSPALSLTPSGQLALTFTNEANPEHKRHSTTLPAVGTKVPDVASALNDLERAAKDGTLTAEGVLARLERIRPLVQQMARQAKVATVLTRILQARAATPEEPKIGTDGAPTQALVAAFLAAGGVVEDEGVRAERKFTERYGKDLLALLGEMEE